MNGFLSALRNSNTTGAGIILGIINYLSQVGSNLPQDGEQWTQFFASVMLAALGMLAKDGKDD